ncbi:MAG: hypothetical protein CBC84_002130 [Pelagibacteraceae bacterium TMED124]|nr:hypothetical protein [Candidatus Neomarinimicrobiota bacterium]RPG17347.1 MAG: hypothetical protein CBC84_002130 [Pelagibacteraceae bacterium TMED124]|tara:strand:+ start:371 stop:1099 length:729 start_codon:yes stop_codon:yes gene_type:complete
MNSIRALSIILAAGRGSRMNVSKPKPLTEIYGKPILSFIQEGFIKNKIDNCIVINPKDKDFFKMYEKQCVFVYQDRPKGTGDAVIQAYDLIKMYDYTYVFVGDSPFIDSILIKRMLTECKKGNCDSLILTSIFNKKFPYARVIRNKAGNITKITEEIDASKKELLVNELFCSHYLFKSEILIKYLPKLRKNKKNRETYLTCILDKLISDNKKIGSIVVNDWRKLVGLNTKEDVYWAKSQKIL